MQYQFDFRAYQRPFKHPLSTSHGKWDVREGIILRLIDETGRVGWGEIAPISWFGSETLEQAWDFCQQLPSEISSETIFSIPAELPACQFGFESAWEWGESSQSKIQNRSTELRQAQLPRSRRSPKSKIEMTRRRLLLCKTVITH